LGADFSPQEGGRGCTADKSATTTLCAVTQQKPVLMCVARPSVLKILFVGLRDKAANPTYMMTPDNQPLATVIWWLSGLASNSINDGIIRV
jgi:hypothetical protein